MKFNWDGQAITATLVFGSKPEKCYIPLNAIAGIFSPDLRIQLTTPILKEEGENGKIIDFTKLRKKQ